MLITKRIQTFLSLFRRVMRNNQHDNRFVAQYNALNDELASKLHIGVVDADGIYGYLQRGVSINYVDRFNHTLLSYAVRSGLLENIEALLRRGANPNSIIGASELPILCYACICSLPPPIIDMLIRYGADINCVDERTHCSALYFAITNDCSEEYYNMLVGYGARLLFEDSSALLSLLWSKACVRGKVFVARVLLALHYSPDQRCDELGETPREIARLYQRAEVLNLFASYQAEANEDA